MEHLRFVYGDDIVPKTPPWIFGYVHTHQPIQLEDADDTRFDGVADHNMGSYVKAVKYYESSMTLLFLLFKPILLMLVRRVFKKQMKEFAVQMMEEYAKSTDNDVDDHL